MYTALERYRPIVDDWPSFEAAIRRPLPKCIWTNSLRVDWEEVRDQLAAEGIVLQSVPWSSEAWRLGGPLALGRSLAYRAGVFHLQEEVSQLPVALLGLLPGHRVLDLCAAPGGKTALIAIRLGGKGTVVANDASGGRHAVTRTTMDRLGLANVTLTVQDGRDARWPSESFDRILVDAPCSAEGTLRKNQYVTSRTSAEGRRYLVGLQRELLLNAFRICTPGGRVVYSTCTFAPEENEAVVADVIRQLGDAVRIVPVPVAGLPSRPGLTTWDGEDFPSQMVFAHRIWPHHGDTGGFFAIALQKVSGQPAPWTPSRSAADHAHDAHEPEVARFLEPFRERFGLDGDRIASYRYRRTGRRYLMAFPQDHDPGLPFASQSTGLAVLRVNGRVPKPTTRAAVAFGHAVTRNRVLLSREEALQFIGGSTSKPDVAGSAGITSAGWVLVTHGRMSLGIGIARKTGRAWLVDSMYPKTFGGVLSAGALEGADFDGDTDPYSALYDTESDF